VYNVMVYVCSVLLFVGLLEGIDIKESISFVEELINRQVAVSLQFNHIMYTYTIIHGVWKKSMH